ncbi:tRNA (adenosine(37)-N6)-threonylcarbamoyltransferase complex ATPase subunit type 1 TsaE [Vitreimonas sp.]|uniref:tRNA (adenosine(37)-N6)-threonylcarbamoyltransferase complex ATPase subunit type 1 TsaE n=1 Tax=Vitreimonas sp. TaxID=3069702 RepID=UPI002EDA8748
MTAQSLVDSREIALPDAAATIALGRRLGEKMEPGDVVCLFGNLGAGKTTLSRGAIEAWVGAAEEAPSPTYTLVQTYDGPRGELWHVDLYRLKQPDDAWELGLEDAFAYAACLIEWPERLGGQLPRDRLDIALAPDGEGRMAMLNAHGAWREKLGTI